MKSVRLVILLALSLAFGSLSLRHAAWAEEKPLETIEAAVRATAEGHPVKNLGLQLRLADFLTGEKFTFKGATDSEGAFSFRIPPGTYQCKGLCTVTQWMGEPDRSMRDDGRNREGENVKIEGSAFGEIRDLLAGALKGFHGSTVVVLPGGEEPFSGSKYFDQSEFWSERDEPVFLGPGESALPDIEYVRRFDVVFPERGSTVDEVPLRFRWEDVEGAESYSLLLYRRKKGKKGGKSTFRTKIFQKNNIPSTEYEPGGMGLALRSLVLGPLFSKGGSYSWKVEAVGPEGRVVNESIRADFSIAE